MRPDRSPTGVSGLTTLLVEASPLDTAWRAVEAALPDGWWIRSLWMKDWRLEVEPIAGTWQADAEDPTGRRLGDFWMSGTGTTPEAALIALRDALPQRKET